MKYFNLERLRRFSTKCAEINIPLSNGRQMKLSSGKLARLADGTAIASQGDTSVIVTVVSKSKQMPSSGVLPLTVNYRQKSSASGRIPMNFLRRELGPTESEILTSRLIDRSLRPMFLTNYCYETQVICSTLAVDGYNIPDVLAINAASMAISLSDVPWNGPVAAVRVGFLSGKKNNEILINPTRKELQNSVVNLVVTATKQNLVVMLEGSCNNILMPDLQKAIKCGVKETQQIIQNIEKLQKKIGKSKRLLPVESIENFEEIRKAVKNASENGLRTIFQDSSLDKFARDNALTALRNEVIEKVMNIVQGASQILIEDIYGSISKDIFRELIFETNKRCDGRQLSELRSISCEVDVFKPLHGSALFQRGQTQVLGTVTLDSHDSAMKLDQVAMLTSGVKEKNFFLHYEFPPFATNETGRMGPANRRELGHGSLAERSLHPIIPSDYPFTIRLTSEVLESNGSSSMASVCAGSLALMDAGVPISAPAAGVAIGLVTHSSLSAENIQNYTVDDYRILTDILGIEDYMGDMDFKIAGTRKGFTALQADIKIPGLPLKIVMESIQRAADAKLAILDKMNQCIHSTRSTNKDNWPVSETLVVDVSKRSKFLGIGGMNLKKLFIETGVQVTHVENNDYNLFAPNQTAMNEAKEIIQKWLTAERIPELEFGAIYTAKIVEIREIGVMLQIHPDMQPVLLHLSHLDTKKVGHPSALGLEVGQDIKVKYFGRDPVSGFIRLSRKVLLG